MTLAYLTMDVLWRNALAAVPLAVGVLLVCRCLPCRPSTRHALWLIVLLSLLAPPLISSDSGFGYLAQFMTLQEPPPGLSREESNASAPRVERLGAVFPTNAPSPTVPLGKSVPEAPMKTEPALVGSRSAPSRSKVPSSANQGAASKLLEYQQQPQVTQSTAGDIVAPPSVASFPGLNPFQSPPAPVAIVPRAVTVDIPSFLLVDVSTADADVDSSGAKDSDLAAANRSEYRRHADSSGAPKVAESPTPMASTIPWRQWVSGLMTVRDAISRLAPIPSLYWLIGSVVIALVLAARTLRFHRVLRRAEPPPPTVLREVQRAALALELRTVPRTLISDDRISPMIWCGWRRVLLLPRGLWTDLDATGRRAVLLHELAHLKRRDHWVRWTELIISCLYWWHPVVWFVRGRLRDEADFCCDAWVTSLMPGGRTGYARALVATRQYVSVSSDAMPAVGLGITTNRTKRFARRLTMVMTQQATPRLSVFGAGAAMCLAAAACLAAPLWACPPDEVEQVRARVAKPAKEKAPRVPVRAATGAIATQEADTTFERHMQEQAKIEMEAALAASAPQPQWRVRRSDPAAAVEMDPGFDDRLNRLEERLNMLTERLEQLMGASAPARSPRPSGIRIRTPEPPSSPSPPTPPAPPAPPMYPGVGPSASAPSIYFTPTASGTGYSSATGELLGAYALAEGEPLVRVYRLPEGKREALYELMAREDVPVLVTSVADGISVQGTPGQHAAFKAFVLLIHPQPGEIPVATLLAPRLREMQLRELDAGHAAAAARELQLLHSRLGRNPEQIEAIRRTMSNRQADLHRQIEELHRRAEELSRKARELEVESEHLESQADEVEDEPARQDLLSRAIALAIEAGAYDMEAEWSEDHAEAIADMIEEMEDQIAEAIEEAEIALAEFESDELDDEDCDDEVDDCEDAEEDGDEADDDDDGDEVDH